MQLLHRTQVLCPDRQLLKSFPQQAHPQGRGMHLEVEGHLHDGGTLGETGLK
jgi:hypothetical protein